MMMPRLPVADSDKKRNDAIVLLPLFGAVFILPLFINLFNHRQLLLGLPLEVLYLFFIWLILVIGSFLQSRRLKIKMAAQINEAEEQDMVQ